QIACPVISHALIKRDRLPLAISGWLVRQFTSRLPLYGIALGNCAQLAHPVVNKKQRQISGPDWCGCLQGWLNSRHLVIVRSSFGGEQECAGKAIGHGKREKGSSQNQSTPGGKRANTY